MKIIIVGNGKVGYAIARQLAVEDHDITIVDDDAAALHRADSTLDVMCVEGNGASISVLDAAGGRGADLVLVGDVAADVVQALHPLRAAAQLIHGIARIPQIQGRGSSAAGGSSGDDGDLTHDPSPARPP